MSEGFRTTANKRTRYTADDCKDHGIPMTSSSEQPPKEYIISITVKCPSEVNESHIEQYIREQIFVPGWGAAFRTNYIDVDKFTFFRQHPAPAPCPQHQIWQHCPVAGEIARKAREDVLDKIEQYAENMRSKREDGSLVMSYPIYPNDLDELVKSLRSTTPQSGQEQPR